MSKPAFTLLFVVVLTIVGRTQDSSRALSKDWFDDDEWHLQVRYVISTNELEIYTHLKAEKERDDFIVRFWSRRDPTPATAENEFRDEFYRRVDYANAHFTEPNSARRNGMETDRGRIYVMFGAPDNIDRFPTGAYEIWRYAAAGDASSAFRFQFSVPPIHSCDGGYRILSPSPIASVNGVSSSIQVYPRGFITAWIPVDFYRVVSVSHTLRMRNGDPVPDHDAQILNGQLGPAGNDPLSKHLWGCRTFETGGMGFTHPLPSGSYIFSSTVTFTDGEVQKDSVAFEVK